MEQPTIYHNPRCTKSRQTLALLEEKGHKPRVIEYLKTPPDEATLRDIQQKLGTSAEAMLRKKEEAFASSGLKDKTLNDDNILSAIAKHPKLLERPIVIAGNKAAIGRPPENILGIL